MTLTLSQLGPDGVRRRIEDQDRFEMSSPFGGQATDLTGAMPSALGRGGAMTRKADASQRLLIDQERHRDLIVQEIHRIFDTPDGAASVSKHVRVTRNTLKRVANELSVAYLHPPTRKLPTRKMDRAWSDVVIGEGRFNLMAEQWARYAFLLNVVHVIPTVVDGVLAYESILPHAADVIFEPGEREPSVLVYLSAGDGWDRVAVDDERFWYLDKNYKIVGEFVHGYRDLKGAPMQPWIQWRVRGRLDSQDYWQRCVGRQLVDSTLKQGVVSAYMNHARKVGNKKIPVLSGQSPKADVPPGQTLSGEQTIILRGNATLEAVDLITPVLEFIADLDSDMREVAESYGVTIGAIDRTASSDGWEDHVSVARQRDGQIKHLSPADRETCVKTAIIMRAEGHPRTGELDPKRVADKIQIRFRRMTYDAKPSERFDAYAQELSLGLASHVDLRQREHPDEDFSTAKSEVDESVKLRNEFSNKLAKHQLSADAAQDGENLAQRQGRIGGQAIPPKSNQDRNDDGTTEQRSAAG